MSFPFNNYNPNAVNVHQFESLYDDGSQVVEFDLPAAHLMQDEPSPNLMRSFQPPALFTAEDSRILSYNPTPTMQNQHLVYDELASPTVYWEYPLEQESTSPYLDAAASVGTPPSVAAVAAPPLMRAFPPSDLGYAPEAFSTTDLHHHHHHHHRNHHHHLSAHVQQRHYPSYPTEHTYTRMFRGRKSKSAAEVLDELRPYACDICQAAFARSHDRDRHKRSHTGETPYRCHGCGTGFKRPDARKRHWERDPLCAQEDWLRIRHTPEGAKRRARAKTKPSKKSTSE